MTLARLDLRGTDADLVTAPTRHDAPAGVVAEVRQILDAVRERGDDAVRELTEQFDGCHIDELRVPPSELEAAGRALDAELRGALEYAYGEIRAYHEAQVHDAVALDRDGVRVRELVVPVDRAGCYAPGGRAAYPSTVLMTVVPARVAGVPEVVLCVPPGPDGNVPAVTLAAAYRAGADEVYRVGGAQAVAAMAYGTDTIRPVDVIVGPGNIYVTTAKREVVGTVGIESLAGPSEVVVVADAAARAELVAADLLAQAEHGPGGAAVLVTWSAELADAVDDAIEKLLADAPRRVEIEQTLAAGGRSILVDGPEAALRVVNQLAPEHLELLTADPGALLPDVRNAGAVFCGEHAPVAVGDYVVGVNHVLPTGRTARFASALRIDDFCKRIHVVDLSADALHRVAPHVRALARAEGLTEHARSVALREEGS